MPYIFSYIKAVLKTFLFLNIYFSEYIKNERYINEEYRKRYTSIFVYIQHILVVKKEADFRILSLEYLEGKETILTAFEDWPLF